MLYWFTHPHTSSMIVRLIRLNSKFYNPFSKNQSTFFNCFEMNFTVRQCDKLTVFVGVDETLSFMKSDDLKTLFSMNSLDWRSYQLMDPQIGDLL